MTTPEPRVRVLVKIHRWKGTLMATCKCPACDRFAAMGRVGIGYAHALATDHAATCPALRLTALLARLEELRDTWERGASAVSILDAFDQGARFRRRVYFRQHAAALDAIIAEARR